MNTGLGCKSVQERGGADLSGWLSLHRQPGQTSVEEQALRDLKSELETKEAKHFKRKAGDVFEGESHLQSIKSIRLPLSTSICSLMAAVCIWAVLFAEPVRMQRRKRARLSVSAC